MALSDGYINTRNSVVIVTGASGSGKTHTKEAISNNPPPSIRQSTALAEDPITFTIIDATNGDWRVVNKDQLASMLAAAMVDRTHLQGTVSELSSLNGKRSASTSSIELTPPPPPPRHPVAPNTEPLERIIPPLQHQSLLPLLSSKQEVEQTKSQPSFNPIPTLKSLDSDEDTNTDEMEYKVAASSSLNSPDSECKNIMQHQDTETCSPCTTARQLLNPISATEPINPACDDFYTPPLPPRSKKEAHVEKLMPPLIPTSIIDSAELTCIDISEDQTISPGATALYFHFPLLLSRSKLEEQQNKSQPDLSPPVPIIKSDEVAAISSSDSEDTMQCQDTEASCPCTTTLQPLIPVPTLEPVDSVCDEIHEEASYMYTDIIQYQDTEACSPVLRAMTPTTLEPVDPVYDDVYTPPPMTPTILEPIDPIYDDVYTPPPITPTTLEPVDPVCDGVYMPPPMTPTTLEPVDSVCDDVYTPPPMTPTTLELIDPIYDDVYTPPPIIPTTLEPVDPVCDGVYTPPPMTPTTLEPVDPVYDDVYTPPPMTPKTLESVDPVYDDVYTPPPSPTINKERSTKEMHPEISHPVKSDLVSRIGQAEVTEDPYRYDLVYLFDTGGQPAFHAILPLFFPMVMFVIFVLKLSEKLNHHPKVSFFVKGKPVGSPYTSPLSHLEIAQHSLCAIQSQMLAQQCSEKGLPKIIIVGTHRDLEWKCSESAQEKNRKLVEILRPTFQKNLIYCSAEANNLIFPLDAKHPRQKDNDVSAEIRQAITAATSVIESKKTPLSWHILELALRDLAEKLGRGFLTRFECITEAAKLGIGEHIFDAALDHFVQLNTILYYRTVIPDLVFIQAQPLMQKITELIQKTHSLRGQVSKKHTPVDGKFLIFRDQGIITLDILESYPDGYLEGVFTAADLIQLMQHKYLISPINQSSYFMPVLLPDLAPEKMSQYRSKPDSAIAPLSIFFSCDLVPTGLFCSLVSSLLSAVASPQLCLKTNPSDQSLMECVASNCIKFSLAENCGSLVLIDTYTHLELHLSAPLVENPASLCLALKIKVLASIKIATHALHFDEVVPQCGFLCESSIPHANVKVTPERFWLGRMVFGNPRLVEVKPPTHPTQMCRNHGWVCSLDPDHVYGRLQRRHTVWLLSHHLLSKHSVSINIFHFMCKLYTATEKSPLRTTGGEAVDDQKADKQALAGHGEGSATIVCSR